MFVHIHALIKGNKAPNYADIHILTCIINCYTRLPSFIAVFRIKKNLEFDCLNQIFLYFLNPFYLALSVLWRIRLEYIFVFITDLMFPVDNFFWAPSTFLNLLILSRTILSTSFSLVQKSWLPSVTFNIYEKKP